MNRILFGNEYTSRARKYMGILLRKTQEKFKDQVKETSNELNILALTN